MRGTKCLEQLEVSRLFTLLIRTDRRNSPVEGLLPNCTLCFSSSVPWISFSSSTTGPCCVFRAIHAYICLSDTPVAGKFA